MLASRIAVIVGLLVLTMPHCAGHGDEARNTLVPAEQSRYRPSIFPDRVVLVVTQTPWQTQTVSWRTDDTVTEAVAQIAEATDMPGLHVDARDVTGITHALVSGNGKAHHHAATFEHLQPDTLYAYRVRGADTWSEWFQFRTASRAFAPFSFLYFGDAQNSVKSHFSRVIREAWMRLPRAALMLHAGDLVNQREGVHDDEWGEWFEAGGFLHAVVPSLPVTGNHEHSDDDDDEQGATGRVLLPAFPAHFKVPRNGPDVLRDSVYYAEYQDVLFVALDSTQALEDESLAIAQAQWLDALLEGRTRRWTIVSHHHPMFSVSMGRDNPVLRKHWKPVFDRHGVDLVLQGHDHAYGRGPNLPEGVSAVEGEAGTVYVVSVAGPKMYLVDDSGRENFARLGEDVQLYQIVHVEADRLRFESRTATGALYDRFEIVKTADGRNRIIDRVPADATEQRCGNPARPRPRRCWNGTEFVR